MKKKWADAWIKDLETTKAGQAIGGLRDGKNKYCCLGRLCIVAGLKYNKNTGYDGEFFGLPDSVMELTGMRDSYGSYDDDEMSLSGLNDDGKSFKDIAKVIKEKWKEL